MKNLIILYIYRTLLIDFKMFEKANKYYYVKVPYDASTINAYRRMWEL